MVQELLDHGAAVKNTRSPLFVYAVEHGHVSLFELLVERGCDLREKETAVECMSMAKERGLDWMLQLLQEYGVDVSESTNR